MKIGDLVEITRTSIGVPTGTIGLVVDRTPTGQDLDMELFRVELFGAKARQRSYLLRDLKIIEKST